MFPEYDVGRPSSGIRHTLKARPFYPGIDLTKKHRKPTPFRGGRESAIQVTFETGGYVTTNDRRGAQ